MFFLSCMAVNCLHPLFPIFVSPFLSVSYLPGVYLQHKDGALMMPQDCQYNQSDPLHLCELSENKGLQVTVTEPATWTGTHAEALFPPRYRDKDMNKSSVNTVWICLWIDPSVCSVFTCTNSLFFSKSLSEEALMIAADDRFRCIVGNGWERSADFGVKIDTLSLMLFWVFCCE